MTARRARLALLAAAAFALSQPVPAATPPAPAVAAAPAVTADHPAAPSRGCTSTGQGYLRARLRGALDLDLAWRDAEMSCAGGPRPDGKGLRITLAGPAQGNGRRVRFVFGIDDAPEGRALRDRATNLTLIFEGEQRLFATRGDALCRIDSLTPSRVGALGGPQRSWQISARGYCTGPATTLDGRARLLVSRFDFLGEVTFEDEPAATAAPAAAAGAASGPAAGAAAAAGTAR